MKKNNFHLRLAVFVCLFLFTFSINTVFAQEVNTSDAVESAEIVVGEDNTSKTDEEELPDDVALDERVTIEDLNAVEASILPGSPLHIFKRFGWKVKEVFETDPAKDAELKIQHANQELAELKQLIEQRGFSGVNPNTINSVMNRFEGRLDDINNFTEALKKLKDSDPEAVDAFLNNLTDKQFKYQKVLESIERDVVKAKKENPDVSKKVEDVFVNVTNTKDKALEHFGSVVSKVEEDNPEKIAERIIKIADKQEGSEFKHLKNLEVLKRLEEQVPNSAKGAIALAEENTLKFFNRDISTLPVDVRAGRFEQYNRFNYGDETRQLDLFDQLKLLDDIPPEILQKIEEVKEFAVKKFEDKMSNFQGVGVLDSYMKHLSGDDFEDIVSADQLASRVVFENNPEIKQRMDEFRNKSIQEFTKKFTDPESQAQVEKFQELEQIMEKNPGDPKVIKMMQELEAQIKSDPKKTAFLDQIKQLEDKMRFEFEDKIKQQGDTYFNRISTLDPKDLEVYKQFSGGEDFLPANLAEKFIDRGVIQYRDYMKDVDNPEQFDRFNSKFSNVSQSVINDIKRIDNEFGDAMQFKRQAMEKLRFEQDRKLEIKRQSIDYKERELTYQLDRVRRQADEEFWRKVNLIPYENFDERKALFDEKRKTDLTRLEEEHKARLEMFNKRLEIDPWCDTSCKEIQKQFIDQEFRHQKERIQDDYVASQKRIEFDLARAKENNPLFGLCDTPESCDSYCKTNQNLEACKPFSGAPIFYDDFKGGNKDYDCGQGKYFDFGRNECKTDPYYKPPTNFTKCQLGTHWNENKGFCEADVVTQPTPKPIADKPDCGQDSYFDFRINKCVSYNVGPACPAGYFLGPLGKCRPKDLTCPSFETIDLSCPSGGFRDEYIDRNGCKAFSECKLSTTQTSCPDLSVIRPLPCPDGQSRGTFIDYNGCKVFGECTVSRQPTFCPVFDTAQCQNGTYRGEGYKNENGCYVPGKCIPVDEKPVDTTKPSVTCNAYFEGYKYDSVSNICVFRSTTGCTDPFKYRNIKDCEIGNNINRASTTQTSSNSNWSNHIWNFKDGSTSSYILNRTDAEYINYIKQVEEACKLISKDKFFWKSGAGNDASTNWQNFGIPDCSGISSINNYQCGDGQCSPGEDSYSCYADCGSSSATYKGDENSCPSFAYSVWDQTGSRYCRLNDKEACDYNYPSYLTNDGSYTKENCPVYDSQSTYGGCETYKDNSSCISQANCTWYSDSSTSYCYYNSGNNVPSTYAGDSGCEGLFDILPGCHLMSESPNVRFNSAMDKYVEVGTRTIKYCSANNIPGCTSYYSSNTSTSGYCGDNVCSSNESSLSCASDCGGGASGSGSSSMQRCFYTNATINGNPPGYTVWCESDYYNCHQGDPSGPVVSLTGLSLGAPSSCESGYTGGNYDSNNSYSGYCGDNVCNNNETSSSCASDCGSNTVSSCPNSPQNLTCNYGYEYDSSGCQTGCISPPENTTPPTQTCMTSSDYGNCDYGYEYDTAGCVIGCGVAPTQPTSPTEPLPSESTPITDPSVTTTPPPANVWSIIKKMFGF